MPGTAGTGSPFTVTLDVDVSPGETFYAIDEGYPSGWSVSDPGKLSDQQSGHLKLANISNASDTSYTYILTSPSSSGTYDWPCGLYMFEGMSTEQSIDCNDQVTVQVSSCSSYSTQVSCQGSANCKWCPSCSGAQSFSGSSQCIESASTCTYSCTAGQCGAACGSDGDCSATDCDNLDGCYAGRYRDYHDVASACQADCTCLTETCNDYSTPYADNDDDGYDTQCGDCNNNNVHVYSDAPEVCDGIDNQCPGDTGYGQTDEGCDDDGDGYCDDSMVMIGTPAVCPSGGGDFDDDSLDCAAVSYPGAPELCDNCDNSGDGTTDQFTEPCGPQNNTGICVIGSRFCSAGTWGVCNGFVNPQEEACDTLDNDCNGVIDDVGGGISVPTTYCQCYGGASPLANEACPHNGIDDNCNGAIDDRNCGCEPGVDVQDCSKQEGVCSGSSITCPSGGMWVECDDSDYLSHSSLYETGPETLCDGYDNDCDSDVDEGLTNTYYTDSDGDGYGNPSGPVQDCSDTSPSGYADNDLDCDDLNENISPDATEICDWDTSGYPIDNNCDNRYNFVDVPGDLGCAVTNVKISFEYYDGMTTNFSAVADTTDIHGMVLEKADFGMIEFLQPVNISYSTNLNPPFTNIAPNKIKVDSESLPFLDVPATIHLYNLTFLNPVIFRDGDACPSSVCELVGYDGGNLTFNVTGFTEYSAKGSCSDGTLYGECSSTKPGYCLNGSLVNRAGTCGCPSGYERDGDNCVEVGGGGGGGGVCTNGQQVACSAAGVCKPSYQTCVNGQWGVCTGSRSPEPEICDGLDNDCDGMVDEGIGCMCTNGDTRVCGPSTETGVCKFGFSTCSGGQWGECQGEIMPSVEICDGLDNDCDGIVDNDCTSDVCGEGPIPPEGCICGTNRMTSGYCCSGVFFEEGCPFAWSILILAGVVILIILYVLVYYMKSKGEELTWSTIKSKYGSQFRRT